MAVIHRLAPGLANQIAAGEVVERPASVVKELVENALDAGARRVSIHIELGGKKQVRVEDDGSGMEPDDAQLALERHATSKIRRAEDLAAINTLGFRGEALPSIASVSHFVLRTRPRGQTEGTEIRVNGGTVAAVTAVAAAEGTLIEVNDIFYNLPARRKFLKSDAAESAQVSKVVTQLALAYPQTGFTLSSARRKVLECPPTSSPRDRLYQLYGERPDLIEVHKQVGLVTLRGYAAALAEQGPVRGPQDVFVNRRIVKDRTIAHAIIDAYTTASFKERSPEVHLFLDLPPEAVDVNVHPTKAEVRFLEQSLVHEIVRRGLLDALGAGPAPQLQLRSDLPADSPQKRATIPGVLAGGVFPSRWAPMASQGLAVGPMADSATFLSMRSMVAKDAAVDERPMIPIGQFRDTFIIAVDDEGIAIVDQHVAHERVLFERVMARLTSGHLESQRLLVPLLIEMSQSSHLALLAHTAELERLGFELETFGDTTLKVSAVPGLLKTEDSATALRSLATDLEGLDKGADVQQALQRLAATTACHAAVKANYPLTHEKMLHILDELRLTAHSTVCPHGRPVMLRLTRREIEKNFERI